MTFDFTQLITEFAAKHEQQVTESINDACRFRWDNTDINIYYHEENEQPMVIVTLGAGHIGKQTLKSMSSALLEANYLWAGSNFSTLSYNPATEELVLCDQLSIHNLDAELLSTRVTALHAYAIHWREQIENHEAPSQQAITLANDFSLKV